MLRRLSPFPILALVLGVGVCLLASCAWISGRPPGSHALRGNPTSTQAPSLVPTRTPTSTATATSTPLPTLTSTATRIPSLTPSPTVTHTSTPAVPQARVLMQAFCRYGPGKAYLYSHGLYEGDRLQIDGRSAGKTWLWVQPENLDRHCWVSASVVEVQGDLSTVIIATTSLPHSTLYGPPEEVEAVRDGDTVTVRWEPVWMTEDDDRGYLIEATLCQEGALINVAVQTDKPVYEFTDEGGCAGPSGGLLYTVEKHGYTDPVVIPWP